MIKYNMVNLIKEQIKNISKSSGVYFFQDKNKNFIYIGKAANLKERVRSHFSNLVSDKDLKKIKETRKITYIETSSEIEALFLESEFIKRYKPKYNVEWKDEKNFLYVRVTKEKIPNLKLVRIPNPEKNVIFYGPYTDSKALRRSLGILSRIFPVKYAGKGAFKRNFIWHEKIVTELFSNRSLLRNIKLFFNGKVGKLIADFKKEMNKAVLNQQFEKAAIFRDKINALSHIKEAAIFQREESEKIRADIALIDIKNTLKLNKIPYKIEAFDISNISGKEAVGSLVSFKEGIPDKKNYRRFRIKKVKGINDYDMMREVLGRRFLRNDFPDLIIIDGGKGHLGLALKIFNSTKINIISISKKNEEIHFLDKSKVLYKSILLDKKSPALLLIRRIRDESHRFAITYHRLLRSKKITETNLRNILGIGKITEAKLLSKFKNIEHIKKTSTKELENLVGKKIAKKLKASFN